MKAYDLTTQHMTAPIGIDEIQPRLSWKCRGGKKQSAYKIIAADTEDNLKKKGTVLE